MRKTLPLSALCLFLALPVRAQEPQVPLEPSDSRPVVSLKVDVDLVDLHVSVVDKQGRPVGGLQQENFKVTENGVEQPVAVFKHEDVPVSLGLVLDNSRSIEPRKARLDAAALSFVQKSNPDDEAFIVHFDSAARVSQDFTQDHEALERTLSAAKPYGQTALFDAVLLAMDTMARAQYRKKALLLVTDGIDNVSRNTLEEAVERVKRDNVIVFAVGLLSQSGGLKAENSLMRLAEASGGRAYFPETPEEARTMMERIARDLREQYTLAYRPANAARDGGWRSVRVQITPPQGFPSDLDANYRHGYYAPER